MNSMADKDLASLISTLHSIDIASLRPEQRQDVVRALRQALARTETPWETMHRVVWMEPAYCAALKTCIDLGLFVRWRKAGASPMSSRELAGLVSVDHSLLVRFLRHLGAMDALSEPAPGMFGMTAFTWTLGSGDLASCIPFLYHSTWPAFLNLPTFLATHGHRDPQDATASNWHHLSPNGEGYIDFVRGSVPRISDFQAVMREYNAHKGSWVTLFPTAELVASWTPANGPLLVDMGGGAGIDIETFRAKHPGIPYGALVLQEQESVVMQGIHVHNETRVEATDLMEGQPVGGAKAYYAHIVFHGWSDEQSICVLKHIARAMKPGYSRLLLHEKIVTSHNVPTDITAADLTMMATFSARERTMDRWAKLFDQSGLQIMRVYSDSGHVEGIIEAAKPWSTATAKC